MEKIIANAQEIQALEKKYATKIGELLKAAKNLEDADNLMVEIPKIASLAKEIEKTKQQLTAKRKEMGKGTFHVIGGDGEGGPIGGIQIEID